MNQKYNVFLIEYILSFVNLFEIYLMVMVVNKH